MAMAVPPLLPTSVPSASPDVAIAIASADPTAMRAFLSRLLDSAKRSLSGARPWPELLMALSLMGSLLAHPFSLAALLALFATWCLLYILRPVDVPRIAACGRTFSERKTLGGLVADSTFMVFLTSMGGIIFSEPALSAAVVCAHGASHAPEDLFLYLLIMTGEAIRLPMIDEVPDQGIGGGSSSLNLLSFINNATGGVGGGGV